MSASGDVAVTLLPWSKENESSFLEACVASFRGRPGFLAWTRHQWVSAMTHEDTLHSVASVVALDEKSVPVGSLPIEGDWTEQAGDVPSRRRGLATRLVNVGTGSMREGGAEAAWLCVGVDKPGATHLCERLHFGTFSRRGRFERVDAILGTDGPKFARARVADLGAPEDLVAEHHCPSDREGR